MDPQRGSYRSRSSVPFRYLPLDLRRGHGVALGGGYCVEIVRLLLATGGEPNAATNRRRSSPLHYAADGFVTDPACDPKRQVETIRCLLQNGADIHGQDLNGATPLHRAVRTRCAAAVKFLLDACSDPTRKNKPGSTPFHHAVQNTGRGGTGAPEAVQAQRELIGAFVSQGYARV
jgi:hypothetical protein